MNYIYTLEKTQKDENQDNLYDLFYPVMEDNITNNPNVMFIRYEVKSHREMRLDLVCIDIFGTDRYIDELMYINNIVNPYSIKEGDIIYYPYKRETIENIQKGYTKNFDEISEDANLRSSITNRESTVSKPSSSYKPITVDDNNKEIRVVNKLK